MGLPNKPLEHTRPETIATPVNKPREAQSLWELPALRPSGGAQSFWPWYYIYKYYIIYYYIIYRAPGVGNANSHLLLHSAVHPGLHCTEFDGWTLIGCYVTHVTQWPRCWTYVNHSNAGKQTPVNKPLEESSQPYGHPEAHTAFGHDIIQLYYINSPDSRLWVDAWTHSKTEKNVSLAIPISRCLKSWFRSENDKSFSPTSCCTERHLLDYLG